MGKRRDSREAAVQFLYQLDLHQERESHGTEEFWELRCGPGKAPAPAKMRAFTEQLIAGVIAHIDELDELIKKYTANYELHRLAAVDRNILRVAIYEMRHALDVAPVVIINEAIEIARKFSSPESVQFINGVLDSVENRLTYCNAGHNPPLRIQADGASSELAAEGAVLGQFPDWQYRQKELVLQSGDLLLLFTDGMVENCDNDDEPFGEQSLVLIAREDPASSAQTLMTSLMRAASEHCSEHFQDDASLIVMKASA